MEHKKIMKIVTPIAKNGGETGRDGKPQVWWHQVGISGISAKGTPWFKITNTPTGAWDGYCILVEMDNKGGASEKGSKPADIPHEEVPF